jgi:K+-transporting ATPase ATPase C chain
MSSARGTTRQYWVAIRSMILFTVVLGIAYPLVIAGVGLLAPGQANGSPVTVGGRVVGSSLLGQSFTDRKGNALAQWFQSRPSAAGNGYDAGASGGSNQGTQSPTLIKEIKQRAAAIATSDHVSIASIPPDALTASGSGLDPDISPAYARLQIDRVAAARHLPIAVVTKLVTSFIVGRELGYIGDPTVNVLELNIALSKLKG